MSARRPTRPHQPTATPCWAAGRRASTPATAPGRRRDERSRLAVPISQLPARQAASLTAAIGAPAPVHVARAWARHGRDPAVLAPVLRRRRHPGRWHHPACATAKEAG
jgi:hypothetical protein